MAFIALTKVKGRQRERRLSWPNSCTIFKAGPEIRAIGAASSHHLPARVWNGLPEMTQINALIFATPQEFSPASPIIFRLYNSDILRRKEPDAQHLSYRLR